MAETEGPRDAEDDGDPGSGGVEAGGLSTRPCSGKQRHQARMERTDDDARTKTVDGKQTTGHQI